MCKIWRVLLNLYFFVSVTCFSMNLLLASLSHGETKRSHRKVARKEEEEKNKEAIINRFENKKEKSYASNSFYIYLEREAADEKCF